MQMNFLFSEYTPWNSVKFSTASNGPIKKTYCMNSVLEEWRSVIHSLKDTPQNTGS